ncbi:MAG: transposase [Gammaproteobacteria bacterium]
MGVSTSLALRTGTFGGVSGRPVAGQHYPRSTGELMAWFATDADCLDYLEWLRWPEGFVCPACSRPGGRIGDGTFRCGGSRGGRRPGWRTGGGARAPA